MRPPRIPFVYPRTEPPEVARLRERVAELEALLVQAEDYAREQGDDLGRDAAEAEQRVDRAEAAVERVRTAVVQAESEAFPLLRSAYPHEAGEGSGLLRAALLVRMALGNAGTPPTPDAAAPDA